MTESLQVFSTLTLTNKQTEVKTFTHLNLSIKVLITKKEEIMIKTKELKSFFPK